MFFPFSTSSADVSQIPFSFSVANKSNKTSTDKVSIEFMHLVEKLQD